MDILEIAKTRRGALSKEIAKLDEFITFAEELSKQGASSPPQAESEESSSGKGADDERAPMPLREFKAGG